MTAATAISGTITVGINGHEHLEIGTFGVPISIDFDSATNTATLNAAPHGAILAAMSGALMEAASRLLESIPDAEVTSAIEDPVLLEAAADGRRVAVVCVPGTRRNDTFARFAELAVDHATAVRRANGNQRITFPSGGSVVFLSPRGIRGYSLDSVYVDGLELTADLIEEIRPAVLTSRAPRIGLLLS